MGRLLDEDMVINALQTTKFRNDLFVDRGYARAISIIRELPTIQPEPHCDEWCTDCREYDKERHNCPRWNKVIRQTLKDIEPYEGHWIRTDCGLDVECKCSVCDYRDFVPQNDTYWFNRNYCPNCGAKMTISK